MTPPAHASMSGLWRTASPSLMTPATVWQCSPPGHDTTFNSGAWTPDDEAAFRAEAEEMLERIRSELGSGFVVVYEPL
jgi:hypothetical protein